MQAATLKRHQKLAATRARLAPAGGDRRGIAAVPAAACRFLMASCTAGSTLSTCLLATTVGSCCRCLSWRLQLRRGCRRRRQQRQHEVGDGGHRGVVKHQRRRQLIRPCQDGTASAIRLLPEGCMWISTTTICSHDRCAGTSQHLPAQQTGCTQCWTKGFDKAEK